MRRVKADKGAARAGQALTITRREAERRRAGVEALGPPPAEVGRALHIEGARCPRPIVAHLDVPEVLPALGPVRCALGRGDKVWLRGGNGAGKTTLVNALLGACTLPEAQVMVIPQEISPEGGARLLRRLKASPLR